MEIPDDLNADDWLADGPTEEEEQLLRDLEETARREKEAKDRAAGVTNGEDKEDKDAMPPPQVPKSQKPKKKGWLPPGVEPVLEEQPKWMVLAEVLDEIETSIHFSPYDPCASPSSRANVRELTSAFADGYSNDTVLVMCNSTDTCLTLGNYLSSLNPETSEGRSFLESKLNSYFFWKAHMGKMQNSLKRTPGFNKGERRSSSSNVAAGSSGSSTTAGAFASSNGGTKFGGNKDGDGEMSAALKRKDFKRGQAPPTKRRRVRGGGAAGSNAGATHTSGAAPMFSAATGANPEALEEEVKKIAELCVCSPSPSIHELTRLCYQRRLVWYARRRRIRRGHRGNVQPTRL